MKKEWLRCASLLERTFFMYHVTSYKEILQLGALPKFTLVALIYFWEGRFFV